MSAEEWAHKVINYQRDFGHYPIAVIDRVLGDVDGRQTGYAHRRHPKFFPSSGELQALFDAEMKSHETKQALSGMRAAKELPPAPDDRVPLRHDRMEDWVKSARTHCERLGRMWAAESKARRTPPMQETPQEEGQRRIKQLSAAFAKDCAANPIHKER
jgi:hypothetical protein